MATHFIRTSVLALCALASAAFAACSPFGEEAGGSAEVTVHIVPDGFVQSRSSFSWKDDAIRDIQVVVTTEDGSVHDVLYSDSPTDLQFTGTAGCLYKLWAAANIGGKVEVGCLEDFTEGTRHVSQAGIAASGMPMYSDGSCDIVVAAGENHASIPLTRMMARVDFSIDTHLLEYPDNFSVSSVSICSPVDAFIPFTGAVAREHYGQPDYDFDSASASDISLLNSGGTIRLYAFENMQGTLLPGNTDPWQKVPSSIGGAGPYCTYLEVVCDYETDSETGSGITYRMYLGKDATTNFDVMRNTVYILTLVPTEEEIHGGRGSWKIETGEWEDTVEAELILTPSYLEIAEGETGRVSSRFHLTWPDGRTEDQPTTCDWNVVGMGYRHVSFKSWQSFVSEVEIYGKSHGTAVISASSGYGNRTYTAEMTVAVLEKTTEPIYTKEYEYELIVSPESATLAEDETAEFQAVYITREYTLADGVRVSDEPSAVTEDDVTVLAAWDIVNGGAYVTNQGQGAFEWLSGPGTATVSAMFEGCSDTAVITCDAHIPVIGYRYEYGISPTESAITVGETEEYTVTKYTFTVIDGVEQPGYTSEILPDGTVEWSSSDASVATVTNGIATGKDYGTTVITAAIDQEHSVSAELSVRHTFFFTGASTDVATPGESVTLYYETTLDPDDISFEFSEAGFSDTFHDASSVIVSVSSAAHAGITCTVTGGNGSKKATDTISISTPKEIVTYGYYVQITPTNATIKVGQSQPFNAECFKIKYINGVEVEHDLEPIYFSWTSEDNTVAIISTTYSSEEHEAIVSGRSAGTVTITATCMYGSASAVLTVEERLSIVSMTMDGAQVISSAHPGHYHYTCTVIYSDGTQFNSDDDPQYFDWRIDPHSEHQADGDGDYSFNRPGEYVIDVLFFDSATGLRESISYTVSVVDPLYEYVSGRLVLLESSGGYDTYGVYLDVHEDLTGTDDTFGPFTGNSCTIGNLYFTLAWSYANGSTWDGCTNVVPKGSTVRVELYVNGKFAGLLN